MGERTLVMVEDPELLDAVLRLTAAAGCEVHRSPDAAEARRHWARTPFVVLDEESARRCLRAGLPRRTDLVLAGFGQASMEALHCAVALGAEQAVELPEAEGHLMSRLAAAAERGALPDRAGRVLAVVGGRGGAGASVLAAATAVVSARSGERTLLVDCDPLGGGLDLVL
uniref:septum site-determining protein Ssd n=1 Tax=Pseudonocardia pini TaxID=2758030 RepID=UPI0035E3FF39